MFEDYGLTTTYSASPADDKFKVNWMWYDDFPILPAGFFNNFNKCDITDCFSSSSVNTINIQGQLSQEDTDFWWDSDEYVDLNTISNLFTNALIHPIKK
jgi:hypothetical protein